MSWKCRKNNGNGDTNDLPDTDESNKKVVSKYTNEIAQYKLQL